jgi:hypothetical protein
MSPAGIAKTKYPDAQPAKKLARTAKSSLFGLESPRQDQPDLRRQLRLDTLKLAPHAGLDIYLPSRPTRPDLQPCSNVMTQLQQCQTHDP